MNRGRTSLLVVLVVLGVLVGIIGGAVTGGIVGFYVARSNTPAPAQVFAQPISANTQAAPPLVPPAVTNLTVTENSAVIDAVKKVQPAVVTVINTLNTGRISPFGRPQASGSGVAFDSKGYIVTNNHVIEGARTIEVVFANGARMEAKLIGADPVMDLAVIQVSQVPAVAPFGDSNALQLGETAIAIGSPLGSYRGSVTVGVISGLRRRVGSMEDLIQTDAAINHGNSGGPLLNAAGQIIGINTLVVRDSSSGDIAEGLGFSIPSNTVKFVTESLIAKGRVEYPFIGISYTDAPDAFSERNLTYNGGILVSCVSSGTPAEQAGIRANDVVTAINGDPINEDHSLRSLLSKYKPGDTITMTVLRGNQSLNISLKLTARPAVVQTCNG